MSVVLRFMRTYKAPTKVRILMFSASIPAGTPFPVEGSDQEWVDLNTLLISHPQATYLVTVYGDSMEERIKHGDFLLVDRSIEPSSGKVAVIEFDGDYTVKRLSQDGASLWLVSDNKTYQPIEVGAAQAFNVWGMVTHVIHKI